ncbi:MAG: phosphate ABC transporter substrate-binding protein [Chordicoccus sp.]
MKMKTLAALALTAMMTVGLAACGSSSSTSSASSTAASSTAAATTSTAAAGSTAATSGSTDDSEFKNVTGTITGSGSSALFPLAQDAADEFKKLSPDCSITMNAGGSGTGLKQVYDGSVDIGNSDVDASEKLDSTQAGELVDHKVCVISMAPIVNKDVTEGGVTNLTQDQLISIFTGKTTNWKDVGGPDEDIVLVTRPSTSGTRALFSEYALNGAEEASNQALETDDSGTLLQSVADTKGSIGYIALSYLVNNDTVSTMSIDGVEPTLENTYSGKWNVWGYEHMYTKGEAKGAVKAYIDYIMSDTYGQKMESLGYCVTSKMQVTR